MRGKKAQPISEGLDQVSACRAELYICRLQVRLWVSILVQPSVVNGYIPEEAEIEITVLGLKVGIAGGPSVRRAMELNWWRQEAKREKDPEWRSWEPMIRLVQVIFRDGTVLEEIAWVMMVLLHKCKGCYRQIGVVEVL